MSGVQSSVSIADLPPSKREKEILLFDFVTDKVIIYTARERKTSRTRAHQQRLQRLAGGHATPQ
jgi:hypothetical protein